MQNSSPDQLRLNNEKRSRSTAPFENVLIEESARRRREAEAREEFKGVTKRLVKLKHDVLKEGVRSRRPGQNSIAFFCWRCSHFRCRLLVALSQAVRLLARNCAKVGEGRLLYPILVRRSNCMYVMYTLYIHTLYSVQHEEIGTGPD